MPSYRKTAVVGTAAMFISSTGRHVMQLVVMLVLARLLVRSNFGAVALVFSIITVFQVFAELGVSVALVQRKEISSSTINSAFVATILTTSLIVMLLWGCSGWAGEFFEIPVLEKLLKIAAVAYMFRGLFSLYRSLLLREMRYKLISVIEFLSVVIFSIITMILAFAGYGSASIVWGRLSESLVLLLSGIYFTRYFPSGLGGVREMWGLLHFGIWVSVSRILGQASGQLDKFIVGKLLNAATLGGYYLAQRLVMIVPSLFTGIIDQVMLPIYSRWQSDIQRIQDGYWQALRYSALLLLPVCAVLFIFAEPIVLILFGDRWLSSVPLIKILSLCGAIHGMGGGIFASVIYAVGRPRIVTVVSVFRIIALPTCIIIGSYWGIKGVAWGMVAFAVIGRLFNQLLLTVFLQFSFRRFFATLIRPVLATGGMVFLGVVLQSFLPREDLLFVVITLICYVVLIILFYTLLCLYLVPEESRFLLNNLRTSVQRLTKRCSMIKMSGENILSIFRKHNN